MAKEIEFAYNPPSGERNLERIVARSYNRDLISVLDATWPHVSSIWIADHLMSGSQFRLECWTLLTWIAARYDRVMLGTCVIANSYRHPPLLAKMAASLQHLTQGRFILGYGAGWLEEEYRAYGYEFPSAQERISQLDEAIQAIRMLWKGGPVTFVGRYYTLTDAYCEPSPDPMPDILVAGEGERYLLRVVARRADWWLSYAHPADTLREKMSVLRQHCDEIGRDFGEIRKATPLTVYLSESQSHAERWAGDAVHEEQPAFAGDPESLCDRIRELGEIGFDQIQFRFAGFPDTKDIRLFAEKVLPEFR